MVVIKHFHIRIITILILVLIIFGTYSDLENNISYGCSFFSHHYEGFKIINLLSSFFIMIIFSLNFLRISSKILIKIFIAELCLWLLKLFLIKGHLQRAARFSEYTVVVGNLPGRTEID